MNVGKECNHSIHEVIGVVEARHGVEHNRIIVELRRFRHDEQITEGFGDLVRCTVQRPGVVVYERQWPHHNPSPTLEQPYRALVDTRGYGWSMTAGLSEEEPLSVSAASGFARQKISAWGEFWLEGEITEWRPWQAIVFFTLKDDTAKLEGKLDASTLSASGEQFASGDKVRMFGRFDLWPKNGEIKFIATAVRNKGVGDFIVSIEKLRVQLAAEGLFDESRKVPLPYLPLGIGLITSKDSDAEKDVITNARLRWSDVKFVTIHTGVSGDAAVAQIPRAIAELDANPEVDVIIIARGGGAFMELVAFSDERIVRAAAACVTPLVSAIGHENDRPLLDEVADLRASTPTDAAKRVVPDVAAEINIVTQLRSRGRSILTTAIAHEIDRITQLASRPVMTSPLAYIERATNDLLNYRHRGFTLLEAAMQRATDTVHRLESQLRTLSPQNTLDRGYAIVRNSAGAIASHRADVTIGEKLAIQVSDGSVSATVVD